MSRLKVDNIEARSGNNISMDDPLALKSYDTAGRNALSSPQAGDTIYNSSTGTIDYYNGSAWFASSDTTFTTVVDFLVIAGAGGGGGNAHVAPGGGGGAGGYRASFNSETSGGGGSSETALTVTTQYTLSAEKGILTIDNSVTLAEGDVIQVIYTYSSLSDTEINDALSSSNDSVNGASVTCIEWILADASKLHDYASGSEDMKLSQVVKNLQDLRNILKKKQEEELTAGDQGLRLVGYNTDPQSDCYPSRPRDISRINW